MRDRSGSVLTEITTDFVMQVQDSFSAKVMLFGEYSILLGSPALSIPFGYFSAALRIPASDEDRMNPVCRESNLMIRDFYDRCLSTSGIIPAVLNLELLREELDSGLWLDSTIPSGYGVGSSGALCASLYSRYAYELIGNNGHVKMEDIAELRRVFIIMESWFHGKSSGLDPLVIYFRHPLIINESGSIALARIPQDFMKEKGKIFLLDSGQSKGTAALVPIFLEHYSPTGDKSIDGKKLYELNQA